MASKISWINKICDYVAEVGIDLHKVIWHILQSAVVGFLGFISSVNFRPLLFFS
jgi:hypothetical protein